MRPPAIAVVLFTLAAALLLSAGSPVLVELRSPAPWPDRFSALEQSIIRDYYGVPGPAGTASKFARRSVIPPAVQKHALPHDLAAKLPPVPAGRRRVIVGTSVILLDSKTNAVLDVLPGVVTAAPLR